MGGGEEIEHGQGEEGRWTWMWSLLNSIVALKELNFLISSRCVWHLLSPVYMKQPIPRHKHFNSEDRGNILLRNICISLISSDNFELSQS
jgi:hypothetical protein